MGKEQASVLVTDGLLRKSLAAVRSLGRKGIHVLSSEKTRFTPAAFSKYCTCPLISPDPAAEPEAWVHWLKRTLEKQEIGVLMPMDDATVGLVLRHRNEIGEMCRFLLPPEDSYRIASDKYLTARLAEKAGVACPQTWLPETPEEWARLSEKLDYPCVIKPRFSSGSRGIRIVYDAVQLMQEYNEIRKNHSELMIQSCIPLGERLDVCLLYDKENRLKASFVQKEIRHYPIDIGPSTVQESIRMPELVAKAEALMSSIPWTGVVEIEFMRDPRDGLPKLLEINPRYWNSLHLAIQSGVDFPHMAYKLALDEDIAGCFEYKAGELCRNLLPGDLLHYIANPKRFRLNPPLFGKKGRSIEDDICSWSDPSPVLGFGLAAARYMLSADMWRMLLKR